MTEISKIYDFLRQEVQKQEFLGERSPDEKFLNQEEPLSLEFYSDITPFIFIKKNNLNSKILR